MAWLEGNVARRCAASLGYFVVGILALNAQQRVPAVSAGVTTQQRLESEAWWPTLSTSPLDQYAGTAGCVACHADVGGGPFPGGTAMARAASRVSSKDSLQTSIGGKFESGELQYFLHDDLGALELSVSRGDETASQKLIWVMGSGELGKTFVYQRDGHWYQSRLSEYRVSPNLDVTTGLKIPAAMDAGDDLSSALGKVLTTEEVRHCFSCHTVRATSSRGFNPAHAEAGLGCEACHGPGAAHASTADEKKIKGGGSIFNPATLAPADSIDFCGACHRTFGDVTQAANPANDSSVVRFQPYRLEKSRCWRETEDARLTCVACHDPHRPLVREDTSYDKNCLRCHGSGMTSTTQAGKACPTGAKTRCVSCHMQKVKVASMHGEFTDHFIRVVRVGDGFPQ